MKKPQPKPNTTIEHVAANVAALLNNPTTPAALYDAVAEFVNEGVNVKDASGDSLINRWRNSPETILAACKWSQGVDDLAGMAAQNVATLRAQPGARYVGSTDNGTQYKPEIER